MNTSSDSSIPAQSRHGPEAGVLAVLLLLLAGLACGLPTAPGAGVGQSGAAETEAAAALSTGVAQTVAAQPTLTPNASRSAGPAAATSTPSATPTPRVAFEASYRQIVGCEGLFIEFNLSNAGALALESASIQVDDLDNGSTTGIKHWNIFEEWDGCPPGDEVYETLHPGQSGYLVSDTFPRRVLPVTNDRMRATITVCTREDQAGQCTTETVEFNATP